MPFCLASISPHQWIDPRRKTLAAPGTGDGLVVEELPPGWERRWDNSVGDYYVDHNTYMTYLPEELIDYFEDQEQCKRLLQAFREDKHKCMARLDELLRAIQQPYLKQAEAADIHRQSQLLEHTVELKDRSIKAIERKFEAWMQHDAAHRGQRDDLYSKLKQEREQYELLLAQSQNMQRAYESMKQRKVCFLPWGGLLCVSVTSESAG